MMSGCQVIGLDHVSLLVSDLSQSADFYQRVLGLNTLPRPSLGFDGLWLDVGEGRSIHLMCLPNPDGMLERPEHVGRDRHLALRVHKLAAAEAVLQAEGVTYTRSQSGRASIFCRDPDGNGIELMVITDDG
jgi:glyoxylase I family protein